MGGTGVTVNATVLATAIRIQARREADVRAVIVSNDRFAVVDVKLRARQHVFFGIPVSVRFEMDFLEAIRRILRRAAMGGDDLLGLHMTNLAWKASPCCRRMEE